jgi:hypothetical protein
MSAAGGPGGPGGPGGAAAAGASDYITCFMLFMVHGSVTLSENTSDPLRLSVLVDALNRIGIDIDIEALGLSEFWARVVCLVSPSNMGYPVMTSSNSQFPNYVEAFKHIVQVDPTMNATKVSELLNFYDNRLYSFFGDHIQRQRFNLESRFTARASDPNELDITHKLLTLFPDKMKQQDFIDRMRTIRNAIGLDWKPHYDYYIGNKLYCPGRDANQCCLYFPKRIEPAVCEKLQYEWDAFTRLSTVTSIKKLAENLNLRFSEDVLTIEFHYNADGVVENTLWKGITLKQFFQQVTILLMKVFAGVKGFDVNQLMSRTCVVDTACSDFCVTQREVLKEVSIISFEENLVSSRGGGGVTASVSIRHPNDVGHLGFWEYLVRKNEMKAVMAQGSAEPSVVKIYIPEQLKEFVPCLTSLDATIMKVEPKFDREGNVVHVVYTHRDGKTQAIDYKPSVPQPHTESMEAVAGSQSPPSLLSLPSPSPPPSGEPPATVEHGFDRMDFSSSDDRSLSPPKSRGRLSDGSLSEDGLGWGGRRRWRRTSKKKCMKKSKTKRRRQLRRRRCKTTQKNVVKSRRRRTCARRL